MADAAPPADHNHNHNHQLVVVGASAGGIEALSTLLASLQPDFPAPIVVAQHLDPRRVSHLAEILRTRSSLPVRVVEDEVKLAPGTVYVVPANRDVVITDHAVDARVAAGPGARPSVDRLLASAAAVFGEGLIAVILTGMGSDGAAGARAVKVAGGTVVVQDPETASFPGMPLSLAPTTVDIVADLEGIGPLLGELLAGTYAAAPAADDGQLRALLERLREQSGIDFNAYKTPTILRRLRHRMAATGAEDLAAYVQLLDRNPDEYARLVSSFLIKVTEFFRDAELFEHLRERVLPDLLAVARERRELRLWSAGCATGEEAYSLAILVSELLGAEVDDLTVRVFATDLDHDAITFARQGVYPAAALDGVPPDLIARYFTPLDGGYEVNKRVRSLVVFGQHDLGQRAPFPRIDLALCRNVLIYFTAELQRRALQLFAFSLRDGGYLVLGKAESVSPLGEAFAQEHPRFKVFRRLGDRVLIPPARIRAAIPQPPPRPALRLPSGLLEPAAARAQRDLLQRARTGSERAEVLLHQFPLGVVVVDRAYDIHIINNAARTLLGIHTTAIGNDFIHLVHPDLLGGVRRAVDAALRGEATAPYLGATADLTTGETRYLEITCHPQRIDAEADGHDAVLVLVADVTDRQQAAADALALAARQAEDLARVGLQVDRLSGTNRDLLAANQELTTSNAELRSANEELMVANEEVQAATEEVETLNEELQATNEELETLNEELQATVEELNTTNDDLQARSIELQDAAVGLEDQRGTSEAGRNRLLAVLTAMDDAVLFVGADGRPLLTNAAYDRTFGAARRLETDDGSPLPEESTPETLAARREPFRLTFALESLDLGRRRYEASGRPVQVDGEDQGSVVVIRDITDRPPG